MQKVPFVATCKSAVQIILPGVPKKSIHSQNALLPPYTLTSVSHAIISCTPDICGAREKIITKIGRVFTEITAFQEDESFSCRAEMAETERKIDASGTRKS